TDGLSEELINVLSRNPELKVIGRTSSFSFKGKNEDLRTIGKKLGVGTLLEGSVRKEGKQIRITAQLIKAADGFHLWSQDYDREMKDLFAVQDEIAASVANALNVALLEKHNQYKPKPEAYNAYLQGRYFMNRGRSNKLEFQKAKQYLQEAVQLDPNFSDAWVGLADYNFIIQQYVPVKDPNVLYETARQYIQKALQLDPTSATALTSLATLQMMPDFNWKAAETSLDRARSLYPENPFVLRRSAELDTALGNTNEAIKLVQHSINLDPLVVQAHLILGIYCYDAGRFNEAETAFKKVIELFPERTGTHSWLGQVYLAQSKLPAARAEMESEQEERLQLHGLALVDHAAGNENEANRTLDQLIQKYQTGIDFEIGELYAYRGQNDKAFEWLERAYEQHDGSLLRIKTDPLFRNLHHDPRWPKFLKKMNLPA
ncbi:MAG TPA: tetratricopeptide repeat protein, partial [Acidobacteriota bacterium]